MTRLTQLFSMILTAVVLGACASSPFVASWKAPDAGPLEVAGSKVAAVVMMEDMASRRVAEDVLAREITARGAEGVALYAILPDVDPKDEQAVRAALERQNVQGIVAMRPVGTEQQIVVEPIMYTGPLYGRFWGGYYDYGWASPWGPIVTGSEIRTNTIVHIETLVYSLRQNKLVWVGQSKTTNPANVNRLVRDTASKVAKELGRQGLILE